MYNLNLENFKSLAKRLNENGEKVHYIFPYMSALTQMSVYTKLDDIHGDITTDDYNTGIIFKPANTRKNTAKITINLNQGTVNASNHKLTKLVKQLMVDCDLFDVIESAKAETTVSLGLSDNEAELFDQRFHTPTPSIFEQLVIGYKRSSEIKDTYILRPLVYSDTLRFESTGSQTPIAPGDELFVMMDGIVPSQDDYCICASIQYDSVKPDDIVITPVDGLHGVMVIKNVSNVTHMLDNNTFSVKLSAQSVHHISHVFWRNKEEEPVFTPLIPIEEDC